MPFSLRKMLIAAPVFVVVGIATACGPYGDPGSAPTGISLPAPPAAQCPAVSSPDQPRPCVPPPVTYYYQPVTNAQGRTYYVPQSTPTAPPAGISGTSLVVLDGKIQVQTADGARMTCGKLTIQVGGVDPADVSVAGNLIRITSGSDIKEGSFLQASARKVTRTATDGAQLILEGDAKLLFVRKGKKIEVSTDVLSVNLSTGQVLCEMESPEPTAPVPPPLPTKPSYRSGPPTPDGPLEPLTTAPPRTDAPAPSRTSAPAIPMPR